MNIIAKTQLYSKLDVNTLSEKILQSINLHSNFEIKAIDSKVFSINLKDRDSEVALIILSIVEALSYSRISLVICDKEEMRKFLLPDGIGLTSLFIGATWYKNMLSLIFIQPNKNVDFIETVYKDVLKFLINLSAVRCPSCGGYYLKYSISEVYDQDLLDSIGHKLEAVALCVFLRGHGAGGSWSRGQRHKYKYYSINCTKCGHCIDNTKYSID